MRLKFLLDLLKNLPDGRQGFGPHIWIIDRAPHLHSKNLFAGLAHQISQQRGQFVASHEAVEDEIQLLIEICTPPPVKTDCIAQQIKFLKMNLLAVNRKFGITAIEGRGVGRADLEDFQQRDNGRQLVDVGVYDVYLTAAGE
jgi:hypothetical protein